MCAWVFQSIARVPIRGFGPQPAQGLGHQVDVATVGQSEATDWSFPGKVYREAEAPERRQRLTTTMGTNGCGKGSRQVERTLARMEM